MRIFLALAVLVMLADPAGASDNQSTVFLAITIPIANGFAQALRPPVATYEWEIVSGAPDQVRHILLSTSGFGDNYVTTLDYIRTTPAAPEWSPWEPYTASWTTPPADFGKYVFAVQGREGDIIEDEFSVQRNARNIVVTDRTAGPLLIVTGMGIAPIYTTTTTTLPTIIDIAAGVTVEFCWTADASSYLGVVTGYRYGFDILDPEDPDAWDTSWRAFATPEECSASRAFFFGVHTFTVEVVDNDGYRSRVPITMHIIPPVATEAATWGAIKVLYGVVP